MATLDLTFRAAQPADLERILEIHLVAFPDPRSDAERRRNFTASRHGRLEDLLLVERAGDVVGHAFLFPLQGFFGGRAVPVGGVASVAVAPEMRGRGVATELLQHLHLVSEMRGDALTLLHAFRQRFYARFGYGTTTSRKRLVIAPSSIPASWRMLARSRVGRLRGEDKDALAALYARAAVRTSGWYTRSEAFWDRHLVGERRQFLVARQEGRPFGKMSGYAAFDVVQDEAHARTTVRVDELATDDHASRLALLGALSAMRDQVVAIEIEVDAADPLELGLCDSDGLTSGTAKVEHALGTLVGGPMVRIHDVGRAFQSRGYPEDGSFDVVVHDACEMGDAADETAFSVSVNEGRASVSAARGAANAIRTTRPALASLLYGGLRASDAARLGLVAGDGKTMDRVDRILRLSPLLPVDSF